METTRNDRATTDRSKLILATALVLLGGSMAWHVQRHFAEAHDREALAVERAHNVEAQRALADRQQALINAHARADAFEAEAREQEQARSAAEQRAAADQATIRSLEGNAADAAKWRKELEAARASEAAAQHSLVDMRTRLDAQLAANTALQNENTGLHDELDRAARNKAFIDASLTEAFRGKKARLTVLARKARKLQVSMVLPTCTAHDARYVLTGPDGEVIQGDAPGMSIIQRPSEGQRTAATNGVGGGGDTEDVKLVYTPRKKLKPGLYKMEVRTGQGTIGTTFLSLR